MGDLTQVQRNLVPAGTEEDQDLAQDQYLTFALGEDTFAIGILRVKEIIEYGSLTAVPMMPAYVRGVINLRGRVVPAMDLARRFGRTTVAPTRRTCIVILDGDTEAGQQDIGLIVDAVNQVIDIPAGDIEPPPSFGAHLRVDFIHGMGKVNGEFVTILNGDPVLEIGDSMMGTEATQGEAVAALPPAGTLNASAAA